ncbi:unnamed protein product [Rotaria sp. Silwood2]|nr:unnamed protein product [Rotaria sp. Silwood2]
MVQPNKTKNSGKISSNRRNRSDKITTFEQLSSEIFYEIFDYLTGNEIYGSFFGLNKRINDLLYNKPNIHLDFTRSTRKFYNSFQRIFCTQNIISIVSDCSIETILQRLHDSAGGGRLKSISLPYLPLHMFHTKIPEILSGLKQQLVSLKIELMNEWSYGTESQTALSFQYLLTELPALKYFGLNGSDQIDSITYLDPSIVNKTVISLIVVLEEDDKEETFWSYFKDGYGQVKPAIEGGEDDDIKSSGKQLYRLTDTSGTLEFKKVATGKDVHRALLHSNDVFILDSGSEIFVWIGKGASMIEKKKAMDYAKAYLVKEKKPSHLPVSIILEGGENEVFEHSFDF